MKAGWITVDEAAARTGLSKATIRRMCGDGRLSASRVGRKNWAIDPSSLTPPKGTLPKLHYDVHRAFSHLFTRDVKEDLWVPDVLRLEDFHASRIEAVREAEQRLRSTGPFDPPATIDVQKTAFLTRAAAHLSFVDRLSFHAVVATFADDIEQRLQRLDHVTGSMVVYSARRSKNPKFFLEKGTEQWVLWKDAIEQTIDDGYEWMIKTDITSYFDAIQHRILLQDLLAYGAHQDAVKILREMLNAWSAVQGLGIPQGPDACRVLGNAYLVPVDEEMAAGPWRYLRYMDDVRILGKTESDVLRGLTAFEKTCRTRGLVLAGHKTEVLSRDEARDDLRDADLEQIRYLWESGKKESARPLLRKVLRSALKKREIGNRRAKFSLWRLAQLLDQALVKKVLDGLDDLAPLASVVAAYLQTLYTKPRVAKGISEFLQDGTRNRSSFLSTWLLAAMLDAPNPLPWEWVTYARQVAKSSEPVYHRVMAVNVLAKGRLANDIQWLKETLNKEFNPEMARGLLVALHRGNDLPKWLTNNVEARIPATKRTISYLRGRQALPSLVWTGRENHIE